MIQIDDDLSLEDDELSVETSRSSGPGGQHVNKTETRVTVRFDVAASPSLSEQQRQRIQDRLASRITRQGILMVSAQTHRSQSANRQLAEERLVELLREALVEEAERRPTRPSKGARRRRLKAKRRRSELKRQRGPVEWER